MKLGRRCTNANGCAALAVALTFGAYASPAQADPFPSDLAPGSSADFSGTFKTGPAPPRQMSRSRNRAPLAA